MNVTSCATASGAGTTSGFRPGRTRLRVTAVPWFTFAANVSGRAFRAAHVGGRSPRARTFSITTSSSTWGPSSGHEPTDLLGMAMRDDDPGDAQEKAPGTPRASAAPSLQLKRWARTTPAAAQRPRCSIARRTASPSWSPSANGGVARNLSQPRPSSYTTGVLAIASTTGSPKPSYRDGRITHAACA